MTQILSNFFLIVVCLSIVIVGADYFVRATSSLAARLGVAPMLIGVTIVAFGTSAPELVVSIEAVLDDAPGIALGNIVGSNIANVLLVLGVGAAIAPIGAGEPGLRRNAGVMVLATVGFASVAYLYGEVSVTFGILAVLGLAMFLGVVLTLARNSESRDGFTEELLGNQEASHSWSWILPRMIGGIVAVLLAARFLVQGAVDLAADLNVRDELIGLTVIAIGTSLPELITVVVAAVRKHAALALGGIVGSNIFNLLAVGGAIGLAGGGSFSQAALALDLPVMLISSGLLVLYVVAQRDFDRFIGGVMAAGYIAYLAAVVHLEPRWDPIEAAAASVDAPLEPHEAADPHTRPPGVDAPAG